jgi:hypothetical protein
MSSVRISEDTKKTHVTGMAVTSTKPDEAGFGRTKLVETALKGAAAAPLTLNFD